MKREIFLASFLILTILPISVYSQRSLAGPTCVLTGVTYQYDLQPKWDGISEMNLCVTGGVIESATSNCIKTVSVPYIRVKWKEGVEKGSIYFTYAGQRDSITVFVTEPLTGGALETEGKIQRLMGNTIPRQIHCSSPTGGNCFPDYRFQWQSSIDVENWEDITGSNDQNISFKLAPDKTTFYRRKTTEVKSATVVYSEVSAVVIQPSDMRAWNQ